MAIADLVAQFRAEAQHLEPYATAAAVAWRAAAAALEAEIASQEGEALTLEQASAESGYSAEHLRHLIAKGKLANAGDRGRPRVRRSQLPRKAPAGGASPSGYDATADALSIERKRAEKAITRSAGDGAT